VIVRRPALRTDPLADSSSMSLEEVEHWRGRGSLTVGEAIVAA
jgi:hypothetical protein